MSQDNLDYLPTNFLPRDISVTRREDGVVLIHSRIPLGATQPHLPAIFKATAARYPQRQWLAQRRGAQRQWQGITYAQGVGQIDAVTQALLELKVEGRPVMVLSGN